MVIMILPLIIRTTEEALLGVPDAYREASFGLGAGKLRTVFKVVLQVLYQESFPEWSLQQDVLLVRQQHLFTQLVQLQRFHPVLWVQAEPLAVHMYVLSSEGLYMDRAYATAVILLVFVLVLNWISGFCAKTWQSCKRTVSDLTESGKWLRRVGENK